MSEIASVDGHATVEQINDSFDVLNEILQTYAAQQLKLAGGRVFRVDLDRNDLFNAFLSGFEDPAVRQDHNCNCCKDFLRNFGHLVTIDSESGQQRSLIWDENIVPDMYKVSVLRMRLLIEQAKVSGVFFREYERGSEAYDMGTYQAGGFHHFYLHLYGLPMAKVTETAYQATAATVELQRMLATSCGTFDPAKVEATRDMFTMDVALRNYSNHVNALQWFVSFQNQFKTERNHRLRANLAWLAVATQPLNFVRIGQTVVGEFLKSVSEGVSFVQAKATFLRMVDPKDYMRPKAAPTAGNIARAEKLVEALGIAKALKRRNATLEDVQEFVWQPAAKQEEAAQQSGGVFAHIKPKGAADDNVTRTVINGGNMTWAKFLSKILPTAESIQFNIDNTYSHKPYAGLVTAVDPDAAPLFTYDREERRNPVSSYTYVNGSPATTWGLRSGWVDVPGIAVSPNHWYRSDLPADQKTFMVFLNGGVDQSAKCLAIFPQTLRPELHEVRATIEKFSNEGVRENAEAGVCGYMIGAHGLVPFTLRVRSGNSVTDYRIDRFD